MNLRSGKISQYTPRKTKGFNVRSRATQPDTRNYLVTSNAEKENLGRQHGVNVLRRPSVSLVDFANGTLPVMQDLRQRTGLTYLLLGYGADYLYCAPAPLTIRGPRDKAAVPTRYDRMPDAPDTDSLQLIVIYDAPVTAGAETPTRDSAMGMTARNYAAAVYDTEWANARTWEWLHIVGHALGGNNEVGNLVAGTFDANTQMIPHEATIRNLAAAGNNVCVTWEVNLFPGSWLAIDITMSYSTISSAGFNPGVWRQSFPAQTDLAFDKLQYDLWL